MSGQEPQWDLDERGFITETGRVVQHGPGALSDLVSVGLPTPVLVRPVTLLLYSTNNYPT